VPAGRQVEAVTPLMPCAWACGGPYLTAGRVIANSGTDVEYDEMTTAPKKKNPTNFEGPSLAI
jgi:hypothetical protein